MPQKTRMLYKHPGKYFLHGDWFDYIIIVEDKIDRYLDSGWHLTTTDAKNAVKKKARRKLKDITAAERLQIIQSRATYKELADTYAVSIYAIKVIKGGEK